MNTATCPGCGDTHLCAGTITAPADPTILEVLETFVTATFDTNPLGYVSSAGAYLAYLNWCTAHNRVPISQRRFIPALGQLGYPRVKRSTMRIAGLVWRNPVPVGRHAAPEVLATV